MLSSTDAVGRFAGIPVVAEMVNAVNRTSSRPQAPDKTLGVHEQAPRAEVLTAATFRRRDRKRKPARARQPGATAETTGKVALFVTCYGNRNEPDLAADLVKVFEHNGIAGHAGAARVVLRHAEARARRPGDDREPQGREHCGARARSSTQGCDIVAPVPSCTLMFKQELPLMFPDDAAGAERARAHLRSVRIPVLRHKAGLLRTDFTQPLGKIGYHVPCHLRVQNMGLKTRDVLMLVPETSFEVIERCSGHNGTYGVKREFHEISMKIGRPVVQTRRRQRRRSLHERLPDGRASDRDGLAESARRSIR